jgi:hypothetical protein
MKIGGGLSSARERERAWERGEKGVVKAGRGALAFIGLGTPGRWLLRVTTGV